MPLPVTDVEILRNYINGVMSRAEHHANPVKQIALGLAGAIVWRKDEGKDIQVMQQDGDTKNVLWVSIGNTRYAFSYNHGAKTIDMRKGNMRGAVLHSFSNKTSLAKLHQIFEEL